MSDHTEVAVCTLKGDQLTNLVELRDVRGGLMVLVGRRPVPGRRRGGGGGRGRLLRRRRRFGGGDVAVAVARRLGPPPPVGRGDRGGRRVL